MKCPNCGLDKSLYTTICDCGFDFESEELESLNKKEERTMKCPSCGLENHPERERCDCGYELTKAIADKPITRGLSCPKCETIAEGKYGCLIWVFVILLFPIGLLLLLVKKTYSCSKCEYTFKA